MWQIDFDKALSVEEKQDITQALQAFSASLFWRKGPQGACLFVKQVEEADLLKVLEKRFESLQKVGSHSVLADKKYQPIEVKEEQGLLLIAGPCSIESEEQISSIAKHLAATGVKIIRGGAYKARTSPHSFQGVGAVGYDWLAKASHREGCLCISEVMDSKSLEEAIAAGIDILQIGSRNMYNYALLKEVGQSKKPVLLKRAMSADYKEWLLAAEYLLVEGTQDLMLCERGIRSFESFTRNTLDINAVAAMKELSHLPLIVDPSHATGKASMVTPMTKAAVAAGADGLMLEVHPNPSEAKSDAEQTIDYEQFAQLIEELHPVAQAVGKPFDSIAASYIP